MGFLKSLFGGGDAAGPSDKQVLSATAALETRHGEAARRYQAAEKLAHWKTPLAIDGLLRRFTFHCAAETSDEEEKTFVAELVQGLGFVAIPSIEKYLRREAELNWPLRILSRLTAPEDFRRRLIAVLGTFDVHFDRTPERKVAVLHALAEHAADDQVADAVRPFLGDTDDSVSITALELVAARTDDVATAAIVDAFVTAGERPRVRVAALNALVDRDLAIKGRRAEVEPLVPEGYYLTREGTVKRLGQ